MLPARHPLIEEFYGSATTRQQKVAISHEEGELIQRLLVRRDTRRTLEVGCAYGLSSMYICGVQAGRPDARHTIIDPFQTAHYKRAGVERLERAGYEFFELIEKGSEYALPELCQQGHRYGFCFIDGYHTFDHTLIDFFYVNRMLEVGGFVVIDDTDSPGINKLMHYLATYPAYRLAGQLGNRGWRRKAVNVAKKTFGYGLMPLTKLAGPLLSQEVLDGTIVRPSLIGICDDTTMIAFEKIAEDERNCEWYRFF